MSSPDRDGHGERDANGDVWLGLNSVRNELIHCDEGNKSHDTCDCDEECRVHELVSYNSDHEEPTPMLPA